MQIPAPSSNPVPHVEQPRGVRAAIATALRAFGSGYGTASSNAATQTQEALYHPTDGVLAATSTLRDSTAHIPVVSKVTRLIDKFGGAGIMALSAGVVDAYARPGATVTNYAHRAADLLDGQQSAQWTDTAKAQGVVDGATADGVALLKASDTGELLASLGIR